MSAFTILRRSWRGVLPLAVLWMLIGATAPAQQSFYPAQQNSYPAQQTSYPATSPFSNRIDQFNHEANLALQTGQDSQAETLLLSILALDPHDHNAQMNLGYIARRRKDSLAALQYFAGACTQQPKDAQCHMELGYSLRQTRALEDAELEFHKAACIVSPLQAQAKAETINVRQLAAKQATTDPQAPVSFDNTVTCPDGGRLPSVSTITNLAPITVAAPNAISISDLGTRPAALQTQPPAQVPAQAPVAAPPARSDLAIVPVPPQQISPQEVDVLPLSKSTIAVPPQIPPQVPDQLPGPVPTQVTPQGPTPIPPQIPGAASDAAAGSVSYPPAVLPTGDYELRALGYEALQRKDQAYALKVFEEAAQRYPTDVLALRQLVYMEIDAKRIPQAIAALESLHRQNAEDAHLALQLGYLYDQQKRYDEAAGAFRRALQYNDPETNEKAKAALANVLQGHVKNSLELYAFPLYTNRFSDGIVDGQVKFVHRLTYTSPVSIFLAARVLNDTASGVGHLPQLYADNAALFGGGIRFQPLGAHYSIQAEANEAYLLPLSSSLRPAAWVPDFRFTGGFYQRWQLPQFKRLGFEANGSVGFYSRYDHDAIAYAIPREILRLFSAGLFSVSAYLREMGVIDSDRYFYNNIAEGAPGLDLSFGHSPTLSIRAEYVEGIYLRVHNSAQIPYSNPYHDLRVQIVFGKVFQFTSGKRS